MSDLRKIPRIVNPEDLRKAMKTLGAAYGIKDKNTFMQVLLGNVASKEPISLDTVENAELSDTLQDLADSILSIQGDGLYGNELADKIIKYCADPKDEIGRKLKNQPTDDSSPFISVTLSETSEDMKKYGFIRDASINDICSIDQIVSDDKSRKTVSVIEFHDALLGFTNRDSAASSIFLQALPSIEISKAVPYFDAKAIVEGSSVVADPANGNEVFGSGISIYKFLSGERIEKDDTIVKDLVSAVPVEMMIKEPDINGTAGETDSASSTEPGMTVGGMELFTSPQTMVRGDWEYQDLNATDSLPTDSDGKAISIPKENKVLDKFRPLMTIESFNVNVTPATGMLATKSASMKIKLHDKSRLNEVIPLIAPAKMGTCDIQVEWGWSHPVKDPDVNPYGTLINAMRCKELYGVMNSSYTFTPEGQVDIDLKLFTKGAQKASFELITNYEGGEHPTDSLKKVVTSIRNAMKTLRKVGFPMNEEMGAPDVLGKSTSVGGLLSLTDPQRKKIRTFINKMKAGRQSAQAKAAWEDLATDWKNSEEEVKSFHEKIKDEYESKITALCSTKNAGSDPYLVTDHAPAPYGFGLGGRLYDIKHDTHVSLAKVLLEMVVKPLRATNRFEEIQMVFYPMNEYSMFARKLNVGQYPINKSKLKTRLVNELKKSPSVTIQKFLNMIRSVFTNNISDDIYGLARTYSSKPDENGKYKLQKRWTEKDSGKQRFTQLKSKVLEAAYPEPGATRTFKKPNIHMFVECVANQNNPEAHILRLHFFDKNATSYSSYAELWNATSSGELGVIGKYVSANKAVGKAQEQKKGLKKKAELEKIDELINQRKARVTRYESQANQVIEQIKASNLLSKDPVTWKDDEGNEVKKYQIAGGPDQIRGFLAANMPTLKYGTEFSGILNATLSTNADPMMETIHMQRQGGSSASPDGFDSGLPMQVKPVTLSIDTFGCPYINFGQQYFVDFSTNTTIDDIYAVTGVSHTLTTTEFKTQIKFTPLNSSARYRSLTDRFDEAVALADKVAKTQE